MNINARILDVLSRAFSSRWFWMAVVVLFVIGLFAYEAVHQEVMIEHVNPALWIVTNLILFFGYATLTFYVIVYGVVFRWNRLPNGRPNLGGRLIFGLTASLTGLVLLFVLQIFFVPPTGRPWYIAPQDPVFWLPTLRFVVYTSIVSAVTAMSVTLVRRIITAQPLEVNVPTRDGGQPAK